MGASFGTPLFLVWISQPFAGDRSRITDAKINSEICTKAVPISVSFFLSLPATQFTTTSPRFTMQKTTFCTPKCAKTPAKTTLHHNQKKCRNATHFWPSLATSSQLSWALFWQSFSLPSLRQPSLARLSSPAPPFSEQGPLLQPPWRSQPSWEPWRGWR